MTTETTDAGIVVPAGTIKKTHRAITNESWKQIRRTVREWHALEVRMGLHCDRCDTMLRPTPGEAAMECDCSKFKLPGWRAVVEAKEMP